MKDITFLYNCEESMVEQTQQQSYEDKIVRILSTDIEGNMNLYAGLTKIKGVSWTISGALCSALSLDKRRKIGSLSKEELEQINQFLKHPTFPTFLLNRKKDFSTGTDKHLLGSDLDLTKEFDIKRLKTIKSYRGFRHVLGLPSRGQRTKSNFRKNRKKGAGIKKKTKKP